ncbi:AsmA family protein [Williamwhitmania taraxaci]|uniref:AsmA family protein n=1 Tax=Williamwhitmania taraxaci TaxID=1640674 RepID=A0A1G6QP82_9BACT|nr:hypothetical protein [Williamwhitmania taraxaci]SDC94128.1 hypothetical protein SAMN05216323_10647 [Williamwhitmania taraxaci]
MKIILRVLIGIFVLVLVTIIVNAFVVEPWVQKKMETAFNETTADYNLKIGRVHLSVFRPEVEIEDIVIQSIHEKNGVPSLTGMITSVKIIGINLRKAIFDKDIEVSEVNISKSSIVGQILFEKQTKAPKISTLNIRIDRLIFDKLGVDIKDSSSLSEYVLKDAIFKAYDLHIEKRDTFTTKIISKFDFDVEAFDGVSADSMYTYKAIGLNYSGNKNVLSVSHFSIHPNYKDYEFTSLYQFQTDRIEADLNAINFYEFSVPDYLKTGSLICSYIEIGKMDINAFRDKRKPFKHINKPAFQDMIYNYPGKIDIDSIAFLAGNIGYTEHAEKASEPGNIQFNQFNARLYKITNDTIYKTKKAFMELKTEAMLMGKSEIVIALKSQIFNTSNTFTVDCSISKMKISDLRSMLENNARINVPSGIIDGMKFNFTANNTKALGKMTFLYHGLDFTAKNKQTDKKGVKAWILSLLGDKIILDSNPLPGEQIRIGIIDQERDPERFLFNYCAKSIFSGIKQSVNKTSGK